MSTLRRAITGALALGTAMASVPEWKGVFYTPETTYKWGAEKVKGKYADATMKMAAIPVGAASAQALKTADTAGHTALAMATCPDVVSGGTITPKENTCYKLVFDQNSAKSTYTIDATNAGAIAFFTEHVPTEFEATEHYLKDTTGADIEPAAQVPEPSAGGGHGHSHGTWKDEFEGKCVCQAKANKWKLDCADKAKVQAAVDALEADTKCKAKGSPQTCVNNYYIMQAHHDHCLHDQLPTGIEKKLHDYEHFYDDCMIKRQFSAALKVCPSVTCSDGASLTSAISALQGGNCNTTLGCADAACSAAIKTVLMAHDTCPEKSLPNNLEVALHDFEAACDAQLCNTASAAFDPYAESCSASVSSDGFGIKDSLSMTTWVLALAACFLSRL